MARENAFMAAGISAQEFELPYWNFKAAGQEAEQFLVGLTIDRRGFEADFEGVAIGALNLASGCPWRRVDCYNTSGAGV